MVKRNSTMHTVSLESITGGGQAIGTLDSGKKAFVWGGLPGETVEIRTTKQKSKLVEGVVTNILQASPDRIDPTDPDSYLSTSPWQIMSHESEQKYKIQLINDAFRLHHVSLPGQTTIVSDNRYYEYRNKVEFSWWGDSDEHGDETLDLAFFRRGGKGKIPVEGTSLAMPAINMLARQIRDLLRGKDITARQLKTLLIRSNQQGRCVWQLYIKDKRSDLISASDTEQLTAQGGEVIFSDPRSPASRITERLARFGETMLTDTILDIPFGYAAESFFQVNIPVYEQALADMKSWIPQDKPCVDMYAGVGTIGLTIGGNSVELIEVDSNAVREMIRNISELKSSARAILSPSETALKHITQDKTIILDPPRAGLHADVIDRLLEAKPTRIIYLSCNPVTQARDVALLSNHYKIAHHRGYNFFPRTPHIEHLAILDLI